MRRKLTGLINLLGGGKRLGWGRHEQKDGPNPGKELTGDIGYVRYTAKPFLPENSRWSDWSKGQVEGVPGFPTHKEEL